MKEGIINFHIEDVDFVLNNKIKYIQWLNTIALSHQKTIIELNYIFCSDTYLLDINKTHLDHDTYTDIITFPYSYDPIESDIYISIDRITENAKTYKVSILQELHRVMAHGLLHLIGFNDKTVEEQVEMKKQEDNAILKFS